MTTETDVRERLAHRAAATVVHTLDSPDVIAQLATARTRRSRAFSGLATVILVAAMLTSVGLALREPEPDAVFAGAAAEVIDDLFLRSAIAVGDRYLGVGASMSARPDDEGMAEMILLTSADGREWDTVPGTGLFMGTGAAVSVRDGVVSVAVSRVRDQADDLPGIEREQYEVLVSTSSDLDEWSESTYGVDNELVPEDHWFGVRDLIAADSGALLLASSSPRFLWPDDHLEQHGYDPDDVCDLTGDTTVVRFRLCGTSERISLSIGGAGSTIGGFQNHVLFAPAGVQRTVVPVPEVVPSTRTLREIYATPQGFGVSGAEVFESVDGRDWTKVDTGQDTGVMMAVRGEERVYRSSFPVPRFGSDDPLIGMAFRNNDTPWQPINLSALYDNEADIPRWFTNLQAGANGWTLIAQRSVPLSESVDGVTRDKRTGPSDFTIEVDGFVLAGRVPYGPASLTTSDGRVVRSWEQFEPGNLSWSALTQNDDGVVVPDPTTGQPLVTFNWRQWSAVINPLQQLRYEVLYSPDGTQWQILKEFTDASVRVLAQGKDELLVQSFGHPHLSVRDPVRSQIEIIPIAPAD